MVQTGVDRHSEIGELSEMAKVEVASRRSTSKYLDGNEKNSKYLDGNDTHDGDELNRSRLSEYNRLVDFGAENVPS